MIRCRQPEKPQNSLKTHARRRHSALFLLQSAPLFFQAALQNHRQPLYCPLTAKQPESPMRLSQAIYPTAAPYAAAHAECR
jgi:hypothetical protein